MEQENTPVDGEETPTTEGIPATDSADTPADEVTEEAPTEEGEDLVE